MIKRSQGTPFPRDTRLPVPTTPAIHSQIVAVTRNTKIPYYFIPKYTYYFVPNGRFFRNGSLFLFGRGLSFVLPAVESTVQALDPAGLRGPCSTWSKSRDPANNSGDGVPLSESHPGA